jgi:hypothetical protein
VATGIALGEGKVAFTYDTSNAPVPEEIYVEWPDGSMTEAELLDEAPAYRLVFLRAPGGVSYPPLRIPSPALSQGAKVTVRAYAEPWYMFFVTDEPQLDQARRDGITPFEEIEAEVVAPAAPMHPLLAVGDDEALFLNVRLTPPAPGVSYTLFPAEVA